MSQMSRHETPHKAWRFSPKVQHPDAPWATESWRAWVTECQSHSTAWNLEDSQGLLHESLRQLKTDGDEEQEVEVYWMTKPLHGIYLHYLSTATSVPSTDRGSSWLKKSYQWLEKASSKDSTEARITSAKEQVPRSRTMEAGATTANRTQVTDCAKVPWRRSRT